MCAVRRCQMCQLRHIRVKHASAECAHTHTVRSERAVKTTLVRACVCVRGVCQSVCVRVCGVRVWVRCCVRATHHPKDKLLLLPAEARSTIKSQGLARTCKFFVEQRCKDNPHSTLAEWNKPDGELEMVAILQQHRADPEFGAFWALFD